MSKDIDNQCRITIFSIKTMWSIPCLYAWYHLLFHQSLVCHFSTAWYLPDSLWKLFHCDILGIQESWGDINRWRKPLPLIGQNREHCVCGAASIVVINLCSYPFLVCLCGESVCLFTHWCCLRRWPCRNICLQLSRSHNPVNSLTKQSRKWSVCQWCYFYPCWMKNGLIQYVTWITTMGGASFHPKGSLWRCRYLSVVGRPLVHWWLLDWGCDTPSSLLKGGATDVQIDARTIVPAGFTLTSRGNVTGVCNTSLKRAC